MKRVAVAICLLAACGCADLSAVRGISSRLTAASGTWDEVAGDLAGSCERERRINPVLADCALEGRASAGLIAANAVLREYFQALAAAADEGSFTVQPGLDQATASVAAIDGINADQVGAVSGLVGRLARLATESMREATLRDLISGGGPAAQTVVRAMDGLVIPRLSGRLQTERDQLSGHFARLILAQRDRPGPDMAALCSGSGAAAFSGTGYLLTLEYCRRVEVIDARVAALADYRQSLKEADAALAELQSSRTRLKGKALARRLFEIGTELDDKVAAVREAF